MQRIYTIKGGYFEETMKAVRDVITEMGYTEDEPMQKKETVGNMDIIGGSYSKWYLFLKRDQDYLFPVLICTPEETVVVISGTEPFDFHEKFQTFLTRMTARYTVKSNLRGE